MSMKETDPEMVITYGCILVMIAFIITAGVIARMHS